MPTFRPASAGSPLRIAAADWNALLAYAQEGSPSSAPRRGGVAPPALLVGVRNDTGGDLPAFVPIRLGAVLTGIVATPRDDYASRDRPLFAGLACDGQGVHAVLQRALPAGEIGPAVVQGVTVARVGPGLSAGQFASPPATGNTELVAGGGFARLVTATVGTGDRVAMVQIGGGSTAARLRLVGTGASAAGERSRARFTRRSGGTWVDADGTGATDVWLVEPNGGVLPDRANGRAYHAISTGVSETQSSVSRPVWEAIVPPGLVARVACTDGNVTGASTPLSTGG